MRLPPESVKGAVAFWSMAGFFCLFVVVPLLGYIGSLIFQAIAGYPPPDI